VNARVRRAMKVKGAVTGELAVEGFNLTNRRNNLARNGNFGAGAYPSEPSATFGQVTAVGDPRSVQLAFRLTF